MHSPPGPSSIAASHEGFTSLSLASVQAFGLPNKTMKTGLTNTAAAGTPNLSSAMNSGQRNKPKSASGLAHPSTTIAVTHSTKPINAQSKFAPTSTMSISTPKMPAVPPKQANSAFRPPTFIAGGATPNAASAVTGVKRRLGMGHLVSGALSAPKARKVEKEAKPGGNI